MQSTTIDYRQTASFAGAFVAFMIGSGFATGQEVMQYFASYGYKGVLGALVCFVCLLYASTSYMAAGQREKFSHSSKIFTYYCGNRIGKFFDCFSILTIYLSFSVMLAGAGATLNQQMNLPQAAGTVIVAVLSGITVLLGLDKIVNIIGKIGPVIIALAIAVGFFAIVHGYQNLATAEQIIPTLKLIKASTNWLFAAFSYVGISLLWLASFMTAMGAKAKSIREANYGTFGGVAIFCIAIIIITLALMANIRNMQGVMIPMLALAKNASPFIAEFFTVIIIMGIYTASVPLLWTVAEHIASEKTKEYKVTVVLLVVAGTIVGLKLPFDRLMNIVYVASGYVGFVLLGFIAFKNMKILLKNRQK